MILDPETHVTQGEILYSRADHTYIHIPSGRTLTSVSKIIRIIYSTKSWDGAKPEVVEKARIRGEGVDRLMSEYVRSQYLVLSDVSPDVADRTVIAHRIWEEQFGGKPAETQKIVYSLDDGVAGTIDFVIEGDAIADLKCTYNTEVDWVLQLGAYATYQKANRGGIIHINPKIYRDGGKWLEYDIDECRKHWQMALIWWKNTHIMEKFSKRRRM